MLQQLSTAQHFLRLARAARDDLDGEAGSGRIDLNAHTAEVERAVTHVRALHLREVPFDRELQPLGREPGLSANKHLGASEPSDGAPPLPLDHLIGFDRGNAVGEQDAVLLGGRGCRSGHWNQRNRTEGEHERESANRHGIFSS